MLLLKYEKFNIIAKDSFLEEMLFKYEKNVGYYQKFEKNGKQALNEMVRILDSKDGSMRESITEINAKYVELT